MKEFNQCSKGVHRADYYGWSKDIIITTGDYASFDWCFCHFLPYSADSYFEITYHAFNIDYSGDEMKWYKGYKKMRSKLALSTSSAFDTDYSQDIYSNVIQAHWSSTAFKLLFYFEVNITVTAK